MNKFLTWRAILVLTIILSFVGSFFSNHNWISSSTIEKLILLTVPETRQLDTPKAGIEGSYSE